MKHSNFHVKFKRLSKIMFVFKNIYLGCERSILLLQVRISLNSFSIKLYFQRVKEHKMVKLFIGNLPDGNLVTNDDVRPLFAEYGTVTECEIIRNYGFVHMETEEAAETAIKELNGREVKGRPMKVEKSESKGPKKPSQKMFIGNVADGTTNEQLRSLFESYCEVLEADVMTGKNFGFVHIDASVGRGKTNQIIKELNGYELNGNKIRVQLSTSGVRTRPGMDGDQCFNFRGGFRGGRGGPPPYMRGPPMGRGGPRGGRGGPRGGRGGPRNAPYPPRDGGYGRGYQSFAEDDYEPRQGGGPMRDSYSRRDYGGGYGGGRGGGGGYGGGRGGGGGGEMYSRRSPARDSSTPSSFNQHPSNIVLAGKRFLPSIISFDLIINKYIFFIVTFFSNLFFLFIFILSNFDLHGKVFLGLCPSKEYKNLFVR
ncbi:RNA-binding protein lark-like isoform X2 [Eurytemora carolleeae]|uniref:RNA-binding protein lark-like isoform X2 n=1 Tax=Eurytemora carolleeae TaxID=1294199 RepID=UPI000C76DEDD|nr:RNA-binding protein lark-like isoform X2 [Eurytemora carolleeae]|eukprot:XP_023338475.1 RNA-binding protein lark-like isoform X2 [Eurytemora affinis]